MASNVPLYRIRRRKEHQRTLEYRDARETSHDELEEEWFLDVSEGDQPGWWEDDGYDAGYYDEVVYEQYSWALDRLLDDAMVLGRRIESSRDAHRFRSDLVRLSEPATEESEAASGAIVELEQFTVEWATQLRQDREELLRRIERDIDVIELGALRALAREKCGGEHFTAQNFFQLRDKEWLRCVEVSILSYPMSLLSG